MSRLITQALLFSVLLVFADGHAAAADPTDFGGLAEGYGFTFQRLPSERGSQSTEIRDPKSGYRLVLHYPAATVPDEISAYDRSGKRLWVEDFRIGSYRRENFVPEHSLLVAVPAPGQPGALDVTATVWGAAGPATATRRLPNATATETCKLPDSYVSKSGQELNAMIGQASARFHDRQVGLQPDRCVKYPGGELGLRADVDRAVETGLSCLLSMSNPQRRLDAARLLAILYPADPFRGAQGMKIFCRPPGEKFLDDQTIDPNTVMKALDCTDGVWPPAIAVNLNKVRPSPGKARQSSLFHEMVHFLGYLHGSGTKELPYLVEYCCFGSGKTQNQACALLEEDDRAWDAGSNRKSAHLLEDDGRSFVALGNLVERLQTLGHACKERVGGTSPGLARLLAEDPCNPAPYWNEVRYLISRGDLKISGTLSTVAVALALGDSIRRSTPDPMAAAMIGAKLDEMKKTFFGSGTRSDAITEMGNILKALQRGDDAGLLSALNQAHQKLQKDNPCGAGIPAIQGKAINDLLFAVARRVVSVTRDKHDDTYAEQAEAHVLFLRKICGMP